MKILNKISDLLASALLSTLESKLDTMKKELKDDIQQVKKELKEDIKAVDENTCKNYLVRTLKDIENGVQIDDVEYQRFYEVYDHYTKALHLNSYIHKKIEKLEKEGKM